MSISSKIREQIINSFRAELTEHVQTLNNGLLTLEQKAVKGSKRQEILADTFRAAHSLKGAARAVGVSAIEQLAHALEDILGALQQDRIKTSAEMFTACYQAIDAIQAVETAYEAGENTPPVQALSALAGLAPIQKAIKTGQTQPQLSSPEEPEAKQPPLDTPPAQHDPQRGSARSNGVKNKKATEEAEALVEELLGIDTKTQTVTQSPESSDEPALAQEELLPQMNVASAQPTDSSTLATNQLSPSGDTIRVSVSKLDALMAQLSELLITKIHAEQRLAQVRQAQANMAAWQKEWMSARGAYSYLSRQGRETNLSEDARHREYQRRRENGDYSAYREENRQTDRSRGKKELGRLLDYVNDSQERLHEMSDLINDLTRQYSSDTMQMSLVIDGLEEEIKRARMLPLSTITGTFGRMMRDMAQVSNKEVYFEIIGGDVELDKRVLEQVKDPLIHLLRNAIDHGIETPAERVAAGKPTTGTVTLEAHQVGKEVSICVSDDGAGLNIAAIRKVALRRNTPNALTLSDAELADLIYSAGFSTSPIITDLSGRGVGLDVVRRNVEILNGRINIDWKPGMGSSFTMILPLALTSSRALLVRVSDQQFAIPLSAIERIEQIQLSDIVSVGGHDTLRYGERPLMLVHLSDVLGLSPNSHPNGNDGFPVVILASAERRMAFAVDELDDEQEVVMKDLGRQLTRVGGIAGGSVMGSGEVILILNAADLIKLALRGTRRSVLEKNISADKVSAAERPLRRILVVDDSITTRTLEKNILEAAGYNVQIATDGIEALNTVAAGDLPDLIISDIAMPRLDGFDLAIRIKGDQRTADIPFILVTSLDSPEDKARGVDVGADAYIVKSSFDQNNLLETIEQLI
jgi:two-component system chemotaxis sensor kinase CheA